MAAQGEDVCLWALVAIDDTFFPDSDVPVKFRDFIAYGTGHDIDDDLADCLKFVGTALLSGGSLVYHVFEIQEKAP